MSEDYLNKNHLHAGNVLTKSFKPARPGGLQGQENIAMDKPIELIDEDLDQVSGGDGFPPFGFNNFVPNQGIQSVGIGAFNNNIPNQGVQIGIGVVVV